MIAIEASVLRILYSRYNWSILTIFCIVSQICLKIVSATSSRGLWIMVELILNLLHLGWRTRFPNSFPLKQLVIIQPSEWYHSLNAMEIIFCFFTLNA